MVQLAGCGMKQDAILFIDVDDSACARYRYREPHFTVARAHGLACLTAAVAGHKHLQRLKDDSAEVFLLETLSEHSILELVGQLDGRYPVSYTHLTLPTICSV